jgi:hypothetical protein
MTFDLSKVEGKLSEMNDRIDSLRKQYMEEAQAMFTEVTGAFFAANPEVKRIHWLQYTPYFNDGDECVFSVHDFCYDLDRKFGLSEEDLDEWSEAEEDDRLEDLDDYRWEGDGFSDHTVADLQRKIDAVTRMLEDHEKGITVFVDKDLGSWYTHESKYDDNRNIVHSFNPDKARQNIESWEDDIRLIEQEKVQYPNRDRIVEDFENLASFLKRIDDDVFKETFGDHVRVVLTKDGVQTEEYSHD